MVEAETHHNETAADRNVSPHIDATCRRICHDDARRLLALGHPPGTAALMATPGSFADYRGDVLAALLAGTGG